MMRIPSSAFDNINVSYFKYFKGPPSLDINISRVFKGIRSDVFKDTVLNVRRFKYDNVELSKHYKSSLPAVTFCGMFLEKRNVENCISYNHLLVTDIDHVPDNLMDEYRDDLNRDPYVAAFWLSPSGSGYKGLVHLKYDKTIDSLSNKEKHKMAFRKILKYLLEKYGIALDESESDIPRLCYMSWDPDIVVKSEAEAFEIKLEDNDVLEDNGKKNTSPIRSVQRKEIKLNWNQIIGGANYPLSNHYRSLLNQIYKKLVKKNLSITDSYTNWVKVAFAIASNIHPVAGKELFLRLCRLDGIGHDEQKSEHLIFEAYAKTNRKVGFGTIIFLARQKGLNINTEDRSSKKE